MPAVIDKFPSAPHKPVQLVLRAKKRDLTTPVQQVPEKVPGESGGKAKVKSSLSQQEDEESVSLSLLSTMPKVEICEYEQTMLRHAEKPTEQRPKNKTNK